MAFKIASIDRTTEVVTILPKSTTDKSDATFHNYETASHLARTYQKVANKNTTYYVYDSDTGRYYIP